MEGEKGSRVYSASEIEAELAKRRMCIADDAVTLETFEPESDDDRAWHKGMIERLRNARALVAIVEQLQAELATYRVLYTPAPDEAFTREHVNAVARLRRGNERVVLTPKITGTVEKFEHGTEFTSLRTERQKRG